MLILWLLQLSSRMKSDFDAVLHLGDLANSLVQVGLRDVEGPPPGCHVNGDMGRFRTVPLLDDIGRYEPKKTS